MGKNLDTDSYFDGEKVETSKTQQGQLGPADCAITSLDILLKDLGIEKPISEIAEAMNYDPFQGSNIFNIPEALNKMGIENIEANKSAMTIDQLEIALSDGRSAIVSVNNGNGGHAIIVDGINNGQVTIRDPLPIGKGSSYTISTSEFETAWGRFNGQGKVVILTNK